MNESKEGTLQTLRRFLFENVTTYDELEALLLIQRQPNTHWAASAASQALGLPEDRCEAALENLAAHPLLVLIGNPLAFRYAPASKELAEAAEALQKTYRVDRFAIVQLMTDNAMDRVKTAALERLAGVIQQRNLRRLR